jgi:hypothetical protein
MNTKILVLFMVCLGTLLLAQNPKEKQGMMTNKIHYMAPRARAHAKAKITVQSSEAKPFDQTASPALMEIRLNETFTGDIDRESPVRALQVLRDDKSASLVSVQRFHGKLSGR